jgi:cobalt/nickel transport system permease protein
MLESFQNIQSPIHKVHARVKIILTLAFILALNLLPQNAWPGFILFFSLTISAGLLANVEPARLLKRSLVAIPFVLSALPLVFWGPAPHVHWHIFNMLSITVSPTGVERCMSIVIKAWLSVFAAVILTATTDSQSLITGFRQLRVPAILISIVELMWRYLFVMVDEVMRLIRARNSRNTVVNHGHHAGGSVFWRAGVTGNMAGSLFLRSIERSERVYSAMLSRGYNGEPFSEPGVEFSRRDGFSSFLGVLVILVCLFVGLLTGR